MRKMINLIINKNKNKNKTKEKEKKKQKKRYSFRPTESSQQYLEKVYDKSKFINRAISFYILLINKPMQIMKELKRRHPRLYKFVGRKKFE